MLKNPNPNYITSHEQYTEKVWAVGYVQYIRQYDDTYHLIRSEIYETGEDQEVTERGEVTER